MSTAPSSPSHGWTDLAQLPDSERIAEMRRRFEAIASLPPEARAEELRQIASQELGSSDETLRALAAARLRSWLELPPDAARTIGAGYDEAVRGLSGDLALRSTMFAQSIVREFPLAEQRQLAEVLPSVATQVATSSSDSGQRLAQEADDARAAMLARRRWWQFWRRS